MHISVLIKVEFKNNKIGLDEKIQFSFNATELGVKHRIGTNFGGNIANVFSEYYQKAPENEMFFELTDCPLDIEIIDLFSGDSEVDDKENNCVALIYEPLDSRMSRVQNFIIDLLNNKNIKSIQMDIDAENTFDNQSFKKITIQPNKFTTTMIRLFEEDNQFTPTVRINFEN